MGNLIVTLSSIFIPLINKTVSVPYLLDPNRWGGIPWQPPSEIYVATIEYILNIIILSLFATVSGVMNTERKCRKRSWWESFIKSLWVVLAYIIGNIVFYFMPLVKAPMLSTLGFLPFAGIIVNGLLVAIPIMLFGAIGNTVLINKVC